MDRRRPLTEAELDRIARAIDPYARVSSSSPLLGGLDWGTYGLELDTSMGRRSVVLRRHDGSGERPAAAAKRLWAALNALQAVDLPMPRPVLFDDGSLVGAPIVVMSRCPGAVRPPSPDPATWLDRYAEVVTAIQDVDVQLLAGLPRCHDRRGELHRLLDHSRQGRTGPEWEEVVTMLRAQVGSDLTLPVARERLGEFIVDARSRLQAPSRKAR